LLPPGATLEGVDPGTSDLIGIYARVAAPLSDCSSQRDINVATTTSAYVDWLRNDPAFEVSETTAVVVGSLSGQMIDVALAPNAQDTCSDPAMGIDHFAETMIGLPPADFSSSVFPGLMQRLFLFDLEEHLMAIIVTDVSDGGSDYADFPSTARSVIDTFQFAAAP
jgi:hypothetical protein